MTLTLLDTFVYSVKDAAFGTETPTEVAVEAGVVSEAMSVAGIQDFFLILIGVIAVIAILWVYVVILFWLIERRRMVAFNNFSIFKIVTFGKLEAAEVKPLQIFVLFLLTHLIIFLIVTGVIETFIKFIIVTILENLNKIGGIEDV